MKTFSVLCLTLAFFAVNPAYAVCVKASEAVVRSGPGRLNALIPSSPAIHYDSFKVLQKKGGCLKVANERGDAGWIERSYLWTQ